MADFDIVSYLASKGYRGKQGSGPEVIYPCFFDCGETPDSRKRKLYANTETGFYTCFVCGASGGSYLLQKHFGDDPKPIEPGEDPYTRTRILDWAAEVGSVMLANNEDILLYLVRQRGLSAETILERKIGFVGGGWSLVHSLPEEFSRKELKNTGLVNQRTGLDFFQQHLLIPYMSRGHVRQIRGRQWGTDAGGKYVTGPGDPVLLYNVDSLDGAEDVIITEGEFDTMVLAQHLHEAADDRARRIAVIGLAGANGFKQGFESYLTNAKRVYLGLDPDSTGKREAVRLVERLGTKARILELPSELPKCDWTEFLLPAPEDADAEWHATHPHAGHTWRDVMSLLGTASGKRLFSVREAGLTYRQQRNEMPGIRLGYKRLDDLIHPGLRPGQVMVVLAKTGTGKTLLLCNLAWNLRQRPLLFVSLEMTREEIYERLWKIALFWHPRWTDAQVEEALSNILICDENRLSETDFLSLLEEFHVEHGVWPELAFVDYLGYFARGAKGKDQYERVSNAVMTLKAVSKAKPRPLAIIVPGQVNRGAVQGKAIGLDDARDSGAVEETADFLLSIWRPDVAQLTAAEQEQLNRKPSGLVKCSVLKSRHGGAGQSIDMYMDLAMLAIVDGDDLAAVQRVDGHNRKINGGIVKFEEVLAEETGPLPYRDFAS